MRFLTETTTGQIILTRPLRRKPVRTTAVVANSAKPVDMFIVRLVLWFIALFKPVVATVANLWPPRLPRIARQRVATMSFLASVVLMLIAENHLEKVIGVVA